MGYSRISKISLAWKTFSKNSYIVFLVYDITNQESLERLENIWYINLQKHWAKYIVFGIV